MRIFQARFIIPGSIILLLLIAGGVYLFLAGKSNHYFLVSYKQDIHDGLPVLIENIKAGEVDWVERMGSDQDAFLVRFNLEKEFSIPANSDIEIRSDRAGRSASIRISIRASRDYFAAGDTLWLNDQVNGIDASLPADKLADGNLVYRIQLFALKQELPAGTPALKKIKELHVVKEGDTFKYFSGNVRTLKDAKVLRKELVAGGIKDAFIVPFLGEKRISIEQALKYEN